MKRKSLYVGLIAGEVSGDILGAGLISELKSCYHHVRIVGIGGTAMIESGMEILYHSERLSVMGIVEVLKKFNQILKIRKHVLEFFLEHPPDVFIGIDSPDFNLPVEQKLHDAGIKTVHYVSPSIWAWRSGRIKKIARAIDLMLNILPFEQAIYEHHKINHRYVGHPLADVLDQSFNTEKERLHLGLQDCPKVVALLPGSRHSELDRLVQPLLEAAALSKQSDADLHFVVALSDQANYEYFQQLREKKQIAMSLPLHVFVGKTHAVIRAADIVMLASGTATLETMLLGRPMIVVYRFAWLNYLIARALIKLPYCSLPNILAGKQIVPEYIQASCQAKKLADCLADMLLKLPQESLNTQFANLSMSLRQNANQQAAHAIIELFED